MTSATGVTIEVAVLVAPESEVTTEEVEIYDSSGGMDVMGLDVPHLALIGGVGAGCVLVTISGLVLMFSEKSKTAKHGEIMQYTANPMGYGKEDYNY